jgi:(S)-ureidoglycine aminohydrolase
MLKRFNWKYKAHKIFKRDKLLMKNILMIFLITAIALTAQNKMVESGVYHWSSPESEKDGNVIKREILDGPTLLLKSLKADAVTLKSGMNDFEIIPPSEEQKLIIIKEGNLEVAIGEKQKDFGPGSIITIAPNDNLQYKNAGSEPVTFYLFSYDSQKPVDEVRVDSAGGSFMIDFADLEFHPHDKGGLWDYYRRPTAMFGYTEMHVTSLNPHIKSHEPHTHSAAEFVLMISGNSEMQIGDKFYQASAGDLYYLESDIPHAIQNTGDNPCKYFAIQWE